MSPISETSAKALVDNLTLVIASCRKQELRFRALELLLEEEQPATYKSYLRRLKELQGNDDAMQTILALEKLKELLQK